MSDRKRAIETLKQLRLDYEEFYEEHNNEVTQAYDMAIKSLETDEAYQLEYEPTTKNDLAHNLCDTCINYKCEFQSGIVRTKCAFYMPPAVDCIVDVLGSYTDLDIPYKREIAENILTKLSSVTPQEPILEKVNKMKSEIADSLEFWDYSPNNNPLARDILETITNFWGDIRGEEG